MPQEHRGKPTRQRHRSLSQFSQKLSKSREKNLAKSRVMARIREAILEFDGD